MMVGAKFEELATSPWSWYVEPLRDKRKHLARLVTEPHRRWALGFACFFWIWAGIPLAIRLRNADVLTSFFLCFLPILIPYYPLIGFCINGSKNGMLSPWSLWGGNLLLACWGGTLLRKVIRYRIRGAGSRPRIPCSSLTGGGGDPIFNAALPPEPDGSPSRLRGFTPHVRGPRLPACGCLVRRHHALLGLLGQHPEAHRPLAVRAFLLGLRVRRDAAGGRRGLHAGQPRRPGPRLPGRLCIWPLRLVASALLGGLVFNRPTSCWWRPSISRAWPWPFPWASVWPWWWASSRTTLPNK